MYMTREEALEEEQEENYHSASDEDFNPIAEAEEASDFSSSEDEAGNTATTKKPKARKTKRPAEDEELDSGDEATIQELRKKRRKGEDPALGEDEEDEGGLIKTRAQKAKGIKERRPLARTDGATADVDAIWASLLSQPIAPPPEPTPASQPQIENETSSQNPQESSPSKAPLPTSSEDYITIKRTYKFAGETHHEEKRVLKTSEEARLYLASQQKDADKNKENTEPEAADTEQASADDGKPKLRKPLRRPSRFEPNPTGEVRGLPPELQLRWPRTKDPITQTTATTNATTDRRTKLGKVAGPAKVNTVEKSRLDWAGYVDKEGIADELDEYGRSKSAYGGRMEFLQRVEIRKEEGRKAGKAA